MSPGDVVYVTKYGLTSGIIQTRVESVSGNYVYVLSPGVGGHLQCNLHEVHRSVGGAQKRVLEQIEAKRRSIQKTLKKLDLLEESGAKVTVQVP